MLSREEVAQRIAQLPVEQQAEAAQIALKLYGPADLDGSDPRTFKQFEEFRFASQDYVKHFLGWEPWSGTDEQPGQMQVFEAYNLALRQQYERRDFEKGLISEEELTCWKPGQIIQNRIRVPAGHTVGKTKLSDGVVNHFFDCFPPAIIYTFAPTKEQIELLLWKEIKQDRRDAIKNGHKLPGRILDLAIKYRDNHFAIGRATNDNDGRGTERIQGQHGPHLLFVLDEAEGIPSFVYNAVESMASGGIVIVLLLANPRTQESDFDAQKDRPDTRTLRISCVWHPNVIEGKEVVPGAVRRDYVEAMIRNCCEVVDYHRPDDDTFELPFPVQGKNGVIYPAGTIFQPDPEFMFRVLGIAPGNRTGNTFVPRGRYTAACKRSPEEVEDDGAEIRMGVDASRYGDDFGTLYVRHKNCIWRASQFWKSDTDEYVGPIKEEALRLWKEAPQKRKPRSLHIRVDGTGGFGAGVIDGLKNDEELLSHFADFIVVEVPFGSNAHDESTYDNIVTEMYGEAAETLHGVAVLNPPNALENDLCKRTFEWINKKGKTVKRLLDKEIFRQEHKRSPDDGDGFVLCAAPDHIFTHLQPKKAARGRVLKQKH